MCVGELYVCVVSEMYVCVFACHFWPTSSVLNLSIQNIATFPGQRARSIKSVVQVNRKMRSDVLERLLATLQRENADLNHYCQSLERELAECKRGKSIGAVGGNHHDKENREGNIDRCSNNTENSDPRIVKSTTRGKLAPASFTDKNDALASTSDSRSPSAAYNAWRRSRVGGQETGMPTPPQMDTLKLLTRIAELESANVDMQIEIEVCFVYVC
jgi:hypothetical protein